MMFWLVNIVRKVWFSPKVVDVDGSRRGRSAGRNVGRMASQNFEVNERFDGEMLYLHAELVMQYFALEGRDSRTYDSKSRK
jgi:hypothetical protein